MQKRKEKMFNECLKCSANVKNRVSVKMISYLFTFSIILLHKFQKYLMYQHIIDIILHIIVNILNFVRESF